MPAFARRLGPTALIVGLLVAASGCTQGESAPTEPTGAEHDGIGTVTSIVDGDTLRLEVDGSDLRVRLIGIDTPEVYPEVECFGPEASAALAELAPVGSTLAFSYDVDPRDRYDRELLYLFTLDGLFINAALVEQGFATAVLFEPNDRHWIELRALERQARDAGLGLWGAC